MALASTPLERSYMTELTIAIRTLGGDYSVDCHSDGNMNALHNVHGVG